jgi:TLC ATP/ADP transporter
MMMEPCCRRRHCGLAISLMMTMTIMMMLLQLVTLSTAFAPPSSSQSLRAVFPSIQFHQQQQQKQQQQQQQFGRTVATRPLLDSTIVASTAAEDSNSKNDIKKGLFSRLTSAIPPAAERQKLLPLALMFFCILFNYTILRDTKDVLMVTAPKSGAEVIPFIKTYCNLPVAIVRSFISISISSVLHPLSSCSKNEHLSPLPLYIVTH